MPKALIEVHGWMLGVSLRLTLIKRDNYRVHLVRRAKKYRLMHWRHFGPDSPPDITRVALEIAEVIEHAEFRGWAEKHNVEPFGYFSLPLWRVESVLALVRDFNAAASQVARTWSACQQQHDSVDWAQIIPPRLYSQEK